MFDHFLLLDETVASSFTYSEILQNFSNSVRRVRGRDLTNGTVDKTHKFVFIFHTLFCYCPTKRKDY